MRYLILGGGGFIGSHLCERLINLGHKVRIFERPGPLGSAHLKHESLEWYKGDFTNSKDVSEAIKDCEIVFHLISTTLPKSSNENPIYDVESNVIGTLHLLEAALREKIRKVIFISSGGTVYGTPRSIPLEENHPCDPLCSYGISKLAIEKYLYLYNVLHGLDYCVLRVANPYGERQKPNASQGAVAAFLHKVVHRQPIEVWGDGSVVRDYIYIGDVIDALLKAANYQGNQHLFNIGSGKGLSLREMIAEMQKLVDEPINVKYLPGRPFDVPISVLGISRAQADLNWQPQTPFAEGLRLTFQWIKSIAPS